MINGQIAKLSLWVMVTNLENHLEDFPQRLKAYQDYLGCPDFHFFHVDTQSFPHICCQTHRAVKSSPSSEGGDRKDGSLYKLMFSRDFGVRGKDLKGEEEPSLLFLKATSYQNHHVFLKYAQDDLQGSLRS